MNTLHYWLSTGALLAPRRLEERDSLQKEKEDLIFALQTAKKDTNQAKYVHLDYFVDYKLI